jgi:hypothetical protein
LFRNVRNNEGETVMKIVLDFEHPTPAKKWALRIGLPVALLIGGGAVAWATQLKTWNTGDPLTAADLNNNFGALQAQVTAVQAELDAGGVVLGVFQKPGNNGTVSCDVFCAGANWGGTTGTCVGAYDTGGKDYVSCSTALGSPGYLDCWCSAPTPF